MSTCKQTLLSRGRLAGGWELSHPVPEEGHPDTQPQVCCHSRVRRRQSRRCLSGETKGHRVPAPLSGEQPSEGPRWLKFRPVASFSLGWACAWDACYSGPVAAFLLLGTLIPLQQLLPPPPNACGLQGDSAPGPVAAVTPASRLILSLPPRWVRGRGPISGAPRDLGKA